MSPFMAGFIATLAEYIDLNLGCNPRVAADWRPEAVMSPEEIEARRGITKALL